MHKTAINFAIRHQIRLGRRGSDGLYYIAGARGERVAVPAWGETTAAGAIAMMRGYLRRVR